MRSSSAALLVLFALLLFGCYPGGHQLPSGAIPPQVSPSASADSIAFNTEEYDRIYENPFLSVAGNPLSTFSIDADGASYSNVRRFIQREGRMPPADAVRIEEFVNYFPYDYSSPSATDETPFSVTMEMGPAPWRPAHRLVQIGLQGRRVDLEDRPPSTLVFLLDVSGSMNSPDKLPLLKHAFQLLVAQLSDEDRVAIVTYAGAAGVALKPTPGSDAGAIMEAINSLEASGSTAGAEGLLTAYELAEAHFRPDGINRVLLATDGDFNVGPTSDAELLRLIERKRESGVYLTGLGFGTGNLKDAKMEQITNVGNGTYYYIDSKLEAKRVLVEELGGTLQTIAKDVKIQVEFNPAKVAAYRLIGYENRLLRAEDFADDTKDAGELGAGHSVTALYEVIPVGVETDVEVRAPGTLTYQTRGASVEATQTSEWLTTRLRYKAPDGDTSREIARPFSPPDAATTSSWRTADVSDDFRFAASVASFGMLLRGSEYRGTATYDDVMSWAEASRGDDASGYRAGFVELVRDTKKLANEDGQERESRRR